jgi:multimeric flavodoxin WrbA
MMKVVAFNGSPRKGGNTELLINHVFDELHKEGIETELVQIGGKAIRGCNACMICREKKNQRCAIDSDMVNDCIAKMIEADGIILGSPVYFADITPEIKALIDRAGYVAGAGDNFLKHKVGAAVIAVRRGGAIHTLDSMLHFFLLRQMIVPGASYWNFGFGREKGEVEHDAEGLRTMQTLGENMAWLLKKIQE